MGKLYFMTVFLISLLLSLSHQSKIIQAREGKACIGKCYRSPTFSPSMIDSEEEFIKEGKECRCKCPKSPTPSPSMIDSEEEINKEYIDHERYKGFTPNSAHSMIDSEETANKKSRKHKKPRIPKIPKIHSPTPSPSIIDSIEGANEENDSFVNLGNICHCKCPKSKAPTPSINEDYILT